MQHFLEFWAIWYGFGTFLADVQYTGPNVQHSPDARHHCNFTLTETC